MYGAQHKVLRIRNLCKQAPIQCSMDLCDEIWRRSGWNAFTHAKDQDFVPEMLKTTSPDGSVNQLIICKTDDNGYIKNIKTAVNKTSETYYVDYLKLITEEDADK